MNGRTALIFFLALALIGCRPMRRLKYKAIKYKYRFHYNNEHNYNVDVGASKARGMKLGVFQLYMIHPDGFTKLLMHSTIDSLNYNYEPNRSYFSFPGEYVLRADIEMESGEIEQLLYPFQLNGEELNTEIQVSLSWDQGVPTDSLKFEKEGFVHIKRFYAPSADVSMTLLDVPVVSDTNFRYEICNNSSDSLYGRGVPGLFPGLIDRKYDDKWSGSDRTVAIEANGEYQIEPIYPGMCKTVQTSGLNNGIPKPGRYKLNVIYHKDGWSSFGYMYHRKEGMVWRHNCSDYFTLSTEFVQP